MYRIQQAAEKIKKDIAGKNVLEVACGTADFSLAASEFAEHVDCIDLDDFRLNSVVAKCPNIAFKRMDATALRFANGTYDTVVVYNALAHLETVIDRVVSECLRVVKLGGNIYFISSFSMDKYTIENKFLPHLSDIKLDYAVFNDKTFTYVQINKQQ